MPEDKLLMLNLTKLQERGLARSTIKLIRSKVQNEDLESALMQAASWINGRTSTIVDGMEIIMKDVTPEQHKEILNIARNVANKTLRSQIDVTLSALFNIPVEQVEG